MSDDAARPPLSAKVTQRLRRTAADSRLHHWLGARELARGYRRLDLSAIVVASALHRARLPQPYPLYDKVCVEIGAGKVLTQSAVLHLLGARRVIATDVARLAYPAHLRTAVHKSDIPVTHDALSCFEDHVRLQKRLDALTRVPSFDFDVLAELGIEYRVPLDLAKERIGEEFDFVFSESVLEHVPIDEVGAVLANLAADLRPGGFMIHRIHLADHRSFVHDPFAFLDMPRYERSEQTKYGNRLRASTWLSLFRAIPSLDVSTLFQWTYPDARLPLVAPEIEYVDENDLRTGNLGIIAWKTTTP